jgi:hypothetical protein
MTSPPPPPASSGPQRRLSRRLTVGFVVICGLVFVLVAAALHFLGPRSAPPGVTMADLQGVADLQARLNADRGQPRLVVIFSPT